MSPATSAENLLLALGVAKKMHIYIWEIRIWVTSREINKYKG